MEYFDMAVTISPELERKRKLMKLNSTDLSASDNNIKTKNKIAEFRNFLVRGIN